VTSSVPARRSGPRVAATRASSIPRPSSLGDAIVGSRAAVQLEAGHLVAAEADYSLVADVFPKDLSYSLMVAITYALQNKLDDAVWLCQTVLRDEPPLETMLREKAAPYPALKPLLEQLGL